MAKIRISLEEVVEFCNNKCQNESGFENFQVCEDDAIQFQYTKLPLSITLKLKFNEFKNDKIFLNLKSNVLLKYITKIFFPENFPNYLNDSIQFINNQIIISPKKLMNTVPIIIDDVYLNEHNICINFSLN